MKPKKILYIYMCVCVCICVCMCVIDKTIMTHMTSDSLNSHRFHCNNNIDLMKFD